jgi:hypothetical protein
MGQIRTSPLQGLRKWIEAIEQTMEPAQEAEDRSEWPPCSGGTDAADYDAMEGFCDAF